MDSRLVTFAALFMCASVRAQSTTCVTTNPATGAPWNRLLSAPVMSSDTHVIAFVGYQSSFGLGVSTQPQIIALDVATSTYSTISVNGLGAPANLECDSPALSADGQVIAFRSFADNLSAGDDNFFYDIFVHDRSTGLTEQVSVNNAGVGPGDSTSDQPSVSGDGRFVVFQSSSAELVPGSTGLNVFVRDLVAGVTERVSERADGSSGNSGSVSASISHDGRFVAFMSYSSDLVPGDTNGVVDVFVKDRSTGALERVSVDSFGAQSIGPSFGALGQTTSLSFDGRFVAFPSVATNLVVGDTNGASDIFVRDRTAGRTVRASVDSAGLETYGYAKFPVLSSDGRYVAFSSDAPELVVGDTNNARDLFVHDLVGGSTVRLNVSNAGAQGTSQHTFPASISSNGRLVCFHSYDPLVAGDVPPGVLSTDVFVRDWVDCSAPAGADCNGNGVHDLCDLDSGASADTNRNGLPDECEFEAFCYCPSGSGACGNADAAAGCANSDGHGASLAFSGSTGVAADDLVLSTLGLPSGKTAMLFMSSSMTAGVPFFDGLRCVANPAFRFERLDSGAAGEVAHGPGLVASSVARFASAGWITSGSTWNFQTWYRDPSGPCGNLTNVSSAARVHFLP